MGEPWLRSWLKKRKKPVRQDNIGTAGEFWL